jgi:hypothetical protein
MRCVRRRKHEPWADAGVEQPQSAEKGKVWGGSPAAPGLPTPSPDVQRVVSRELIPGVVEAAKTRIPPEFLGGLFSPHTNMKTTESG